VVSHEQLNGGVGLGLEGRHVTGVVSATIVHHDNLVGRASIGQVLADLLQRTRESPLFVIGGDDDSQINAVSHG
jgi:hypothetical protein